MELFSGVKIAPKLKDHHTFGCPVFALATPLQQGQSIPKWNPRARLGVKLGPSPFHARSVSLDLNLTTGLVSPQYHIIHDDFFETVKMDSGTSIVSNWQQISGMREEPPSTISEYRCNLQRSNIPNVSGGLPIQEEASFEAP